MEAFWACIVVFHRKYFDDHQLSRFVYDVPGMSPELINTRTYQSIAFSGGCAGFMYWLVVFPVDTISLFC
ncbi:hypothetical protein PsorP6_016875 [Peronosclerospora sorghi]|uniref:Uncharacterized protein n=1 Tax=Peronosclerospora sorghi TaxID=230839 RepID=A0ACC0WDX2_9STRA|nr:hypothetical protein PsorP6_016875 [Peronosclerospora sorghi]